MPARATEQLLLWTRRTGAALLTALALARPAGAQSTQPVFTKPGSGITIQVTNLYNGMPARGFLPVRVNIANLSGSDGQWEVETQAVQGSSANLGDNHFGAKATCAVPAQATRMFEVLAPLPDSTGQSPPRVFVHITGPGVVNPEIVFLSNMQMPPPSALRVTVPIGGLSYPGYAPVRAALRPASYTTVSTNASGDTTRTTTTSLPNGNTQVEVIITHPDGSTQTTNTTIDSLGRRLSSTSRTTGPTGTPTSAYTGATIINGGTLSPPAATASAPTVTPIASVTRNADGSVTQTTVTHRPDGNTLTVKKTSKADGTTTAAYTLTNAAGTVVKEGAGDGADAGPPATPAPSANPPPVAPPSPAGAINFNGRATIFAGALQDAKPQPGDQTTNSDSTDSLTGNPVHTTVTKHADGTITTATATPNKYGTEIVTSTTDASGAKIAGSHEFSLSPAAMEQALPGGAPSSPSLPNASVGGGRLRNVSAAVNASASTASAPANSSASPSGGLMFSAVWSGNSSSADNNRALVSVPQVTLPPEAVQAFGGGNVAIGVGQTTLYPAASGSVVIAQNSPAAASASSPRLAPPPPPPPPPPVPSTPFAGRSGVTFSTGGAGSLTLRGGRGYTVRNLPPGAPIFVGLSSTLAHDHGEQIKNYFLSACRRPLQQTAFDPAMMSADWRAYLGFDLVFFTAADWLAAPPEVRLALTQWVAAGGELRLIANQDGGLNLPPRVNEHYGAGAIELFTEDELNNFNFALEHTDPQERTPFNLLYHPVHSFNAAGTGLGYDVPPGMQAREYTLSEDNIIRLTGLDPYSAAPTTGPGFTTSNPVVAVESGLMELFNRSGAPMGGGTLHLKPDPRHLVVINTPAGLNAVAAVLARYGESEVGAPASPANAESPEIQRLRTIIFPRVSYDVPTPLDQIASSLQALSGRYDPNGLGVAIHVYPPGSGNATMPRVTLTEPSELSLYELLRDAGAGAKPAYHIVFEGNTIALREGPDPSAKVAAAAPGSAPVQAANAPPAADPKNFADVMPHVGNHYFVVACVIIAFGLLAGPLNLFLFCGGSRRPHLLWVTPLLALLASVAILAFILLAEGIGGRGIYFRVTQLNPDGKFAIESEVESSVTGLLTRRDFDLGELAWVLDYDQSDPGLPNWLHGNFVQDGKHYTGDWFASRREQLLFARAVVPSRASLRADPATAGKPPVLHSEYNGLMVNLYYQDNDGNYWKIDRMTDGQPTTLQPATADEFKTAWEASVNTAPSLLSTYLGKVAPERGTFFALGSGEASALEPDLSGLRLNRFRHLITGPVAQ